MRVVKVLAPLGKLNTHIFLFFSFCLREKEATLKAVRGYVIPHGRPLPYWKGFSELLFHSGGASLLSLKHHAIRDF
jgi:hypothetical protein